MSHWFHRNPIKATLPIEFGARSFPSSSDSQLICTQLKTTRANLCSLWADPSQPLEKCDEEFRRYASLLVGFLQDLSGDGAEGSESKLRYSIRSKWNHSLNSSHTHEEQDAIYEMSSAMINNAMWLTKHAAYKAAICNGETATESDAKEVHRCLKQAAGQFKFVQDNLVGSLIKTSTNVVEPFEDTTDLILTTYISQCKAEAQEITIARAVELKHSPSLICSISESTSILFQSAADMLASLDNKYVAEKWQRYLALKSKFYKAQAYCYFGQDLLASDKCGEAIKVLDKARQVYEECEALCKEYAVTKGPGTRAVPERHPFFINLGEVIKRVAEKCTRENGMIYHQKLPDECPVLETKAIHGLAEPDEYKYPEASPLWAPAAYNAFNLSKGMASQSKKNKDKDGPSKEKVTAAKEEPIPQGNAAPNTDSGCTIS